MVAEESNQAVPGCSLVGEDLSHLITQIEEEERKRYLLMTVPPCGARISGSSTTALSFPEGALLTLGDLRHKEGKTKYDNVINKSVYIKDDLGALSKEMGEHDGLIRRVLKNHTTGEPVLNKLAILPEVMTKLLGDLKEVASGRSQKDDNNKQADGAIAAFSPQAGHRDGVIEATTDEAREPHHANSRDSPAEVSH
ncbi:hypothetical protein NDU88_004271 [Pleurodeles waltl]|uniref:Uncharacterized protein n=1 Tax=Pleurodeles waltl TaxID=8319 RepID=A0AAV7RF96_PLEWA|nr:hypothetical protein NDU88_004271 [Pleurodeles waltl]